MHFYSALTQGEIHTPWQITSALYCQNFGSSPYLKADTAHWEIAMIFKHAEVLGHQCCSMDKTHGCFCVALPLGVLLCHVLQPSQSQVRRCLISFGNSNNARKKGNMTDLFFSNNREDFYSPLPGLNGRWHVFMPWIWFTEHWAKEITREEEPWQREIMRRVKLLNPGPFGDPDSCPTPGLCPPATSHGSTATLSILPGPLQEASCAEVAVYIQNSYWFCPQLVANIHSSCAHLSTEFPQKQL